MIKALFFDLDGTLLTSAKKLSPNTVNALQACKSQGIKVFAATARPPLLGKMLPLSPGEASLLCDGGVFFNGGCICCGNSREYSLIPEKAVKRALQIMSGYPRVNIAIQMTENRHSFRHGLREDEAALWGITKEDYLPFESFDPSAAVKMVLFSVSLVFSPGELPCGLFDALSREMGDDANVYLTDKGKCIQIISKGINKKLAIDRICEKYGLDRDEIAVFGDDYTDMEMLREFPHSFPMGNAGDEIKACARHITSGNDEDGIYFALKNILSLF